MSAPVLVKPTACWMCGGDGVVGIVPCQQIGMLTTCPQCRCICGCGREVGMPGLHDDCWAADWAGSMPTPQPTKEA